eukprot:m.237034 g.237034  ORF g.237034 m.237034 type:complete len:590 (+) comp26197_c0_seq1:64-1833(+)
MAVAAFVLISAATAGPGWATECSPTATFRVEVGLRNHGMELVRERAHAASDPTSAIYGQFFSFDEVNAVVHRPANLVAVEAVLEEHMQRLPHAVVTPATISTDRQWIRFDSATSCVPTALRALTEHVATVITHASSTTKGNQTEWRKGAIPPTPTAETEYFMLADLQRRQRQPRLPLGRVGHVDQPPSSWPPGPPLTKYLTLDAIEAYYNVTGSTPTAAPSLATAAVFEVNKLLYNGVIVEEYNPPDLASFQLLSKLPGDPVTQFAGDTVTIGCFEYTCAEPMLDVEMLRGVAPDANFTYWVTNVPDSGDTNAVLTWLTRLSATKSPSWVHSISCGPPESSMTPMVASLMDQEFAKLTSRGLTFVASSGDDGVNNRAARGNPSKCGLSPQYPASSPWVTAVGGTIGPQVSIPERTCQTDVENAPITSGGGFSTRWAQPSYQSKAVAGYLAKMKSSIPPAGSFNGSQRAYPDVSLLSWNIDSIVDQNLYPGSGTSASAPLFAGMLTRILGARLAKGMPPFGLLNIQLYKLAGSAVFRDITIGDNHCTGVFGSDQNYTCCPEGFNATAGWDPVTGLGSIDYANLKAQLLQS